MSSIITLSLFSLVIFLSHNLGYGELDYYFYDRTCPHLPMIVRFGVWSALKSDTRMAASILRMHFHDCFVNGCDASILLDDTEDLKGEKNALANKNSIRGYEVIDKIKADVESACPHTVSCVDILTLAAREAVVQSGGHPWPVPLGRRDSLTAIQQAVNVHLPSPFEPLESIAAKFGSKGLELKDVVVLSGAHTIGYAQCFTFIRRLFDYKSSGNPDPTLDTSLLSNLRNTCPNVASSSTKLAPLDSNTFYTFDNSYYKNLMSNTGLLESDQALMNDPRTAEMVNTYSNYPFLFLKDFGESMWKLGNVGVLTGENGEIRNKCGVVNSRSFGGGF